jgi:hypothetical protein
MIDEIDRQKHSPVKIVTRICNSRTRESFFDILSDIDKFKDESSFKCRNGLSPLQHIKKTENPSLAQHLQVVSDKKKIE